MVGAPVSVILRSTALGFKYLVVMRGLAAAPGGGASGGEMGRATLGGELTRLGAMA